MIVLGDGRCEYALWSANGLPPPLFVVCCSPVEVYFATASMDRTARLWSCDSVYPIRVFAGHNSAVDVRKIHCCDSLWSLNTPSLPFPAPSGGPVPPQLQLPGHWEQRPDVSAVGRAEWAVCAPVLWNQGGWGRGGACLLGLSTCNPSPSIPSGVSHSVGMGGACLLAVRGEWSTSGTLRKGQC